MIGSRAGFRPIMLLATARSKIARKYVMHFLAYDSLHPVLMRPFGVFQRRSGRLLTKALRSSALTLPTSISPTAALMRLNTDERVPRLFSDQSPFRSLK